MDMLRRSLVRLSRIDIAISLSVLVLALCLTLSRPAHAMNIQEITSPGGVKAWLVEAHDNPLLAVRFSFEGGNSQDPEGKDGVANFLTAMLDEGAGDITASDFQEQMESLAMRMRYEVSSGERQCAAAAVGLGSGRDPQLGGEGRRASNFEVLGADPSRVVGTPRGGLRQRLVRELG
jgi:hypothetical protein